MLKDAFQKAGISKKDFKKGSEKKEKKSVSKKVDIKNQNGTTPKSNFQFKKSGNIKLKLTAISPIHIGSKEVYEPTNFAIDKQILYYFRDEDFFDALDSMARQKFMNIINENRSDSFARINKLVKDNINIVKKIAILQVKTTKGVQKAYDSKTGKVTQIEGSKGNFTKVFNRFEIQRIQRKQVKDTSGNYHQMGYICGSSLKGAISTAYQEFISQTEGKQARIDKFENNKTIKEHIFKYLKIGDTLVQKISTKIGFACNKERFEDDETGPSTLIETIQPNSQFIVDVNYQQYDLNNNKILDMKDLFESLNAHYLPIFKTIFKQETNNKDEYILEYLPDDFYEKYKNFTPKENQFLIRVGKHSGARAVTIFGATNDRREIRVKESKRREIKLEEETTTWLFGEKQNSTQNLLPFGWLLCEIVDI